MNINYNFPIKKIANTQFKSMSLLVNSEINIYLGLINYKFAFFY